ncbi:MAG TPA: hypothetical protein VG672_12655 [Bryobacteraceae bacterium]|nr:hypothetical protein [Bryobacteraceae bacterium]
MDDFRVDSVTSSALSGHQELPDAARRRKGKRPPFRLPDQEGEDVVRLSETEEGSEAPELPEDSYCPSRPDAGQE